jgi:hypothetical protein
MSHASPIPVLVLEIMLLIPLHAKQTQRCLSCAETIALPNACPTSVIVSGDVGELLLTIILADVGAASEVLGRAGIDPLQAVGVMRYGQQR